MRALAKILLGALYALSLCSCAGLGRGKYIVPVVGEEAREVSADYWRTGGLPKGPPYYSRKTAEPSWGLMRPPVYEMPFDGILYYALYPIIINEQGLFIGPPYLPVIPIFFLPSASSRYRDPTSSHRVTIEWRGDVEKAKQIKVWQIISSIRCEGKRKIISTQEGQLKCEYVFEHELTEQTELLLSGPASGKDVRVILQYRSGIEFIPYIKIL